MRPLNLSADAAWRRRYRFPMILFTQIAKRNPARGLVIMNDTPTGTYQLHAWDVETGTTRPLTDAPHGVTFGGISPDGTSVYYLQDAAGQASPVAEMGHLMRVPFEGGTPQSLTPTLPPYAFWALTQCYSGRVVSFTIQDADGFKIYLKTDAGLTLLHRSAHQAFGAMLSFDAEYAVIATSERSESHELALMAFDLRGQAASQTVKVLQEEDATISPLQFSPVAGDTRLLATTNATGFDRPLLWDVATGDRTDLPFVGMDGDISPLDWSPDGTKLLLMQMREAAYQLYVYDLEHSTLNRLQHPSGTYYSGYFHTDGEIFVHWADATHPPQIVVISAATGERLRVGLQLESDAAPLPPSTAWRSVKFPSSGGQMVQGWLAVPEGDAPFPTIVHLHGGPTAVQTEIYAPDAQAWLDHGFAFLSVNYRGSTTFGRQFEQAIWGDLGGLEVDDLIAAREYLVRNGIAHRKAIILTGSAYGGYLTLQALGKRPDLWAGGIAQDAIADWTLAYEDQAAGLRAYQLALFGGTPAELPEQHAKSSPMTYVNQVDAPVLLLHTQPPSRDIALYSDRLQQLGKAVQVAAFAVDDHHAHGREQRIEQQALQLQWAHQVLAKLFA